jgi:hypothetical protein
MSKEIPVAFGPCCFCNEQIAESESDPCNVTVETAHGGWQVWFCHAECFKERLAKREDGFFDPGIF